MTIDDLKRALVEVREICRNRRLCSDIDGDCQFLKKNGYCFSWIGLKAGALMTGRRPPMRPIDADRLYNEILSMNIILGGKLIFHPAVRESVLDAIEMSETLDYAPVVHGEFEFEEFEYIPGLCVAPVHCKTCGTTYFTINKDGKRTVCCPYCGALMDGKEGKA